MSSSSAELQPELEDEQPARRRARLRFLVLGLAIAAFLLARSRPQTPKPALGVA